MSSFVAPFMNCSTEHETTAPLKRVQTCYSKIVVDVTEDMLQLAWGEEALVTPERRVNNFKKTLLQTFEGHCDSRQHSIKYYVFDHMVENIQDSEPFLY